MKRKRVWTIVVLLLLFPLYQACDKCQLTRNPTQPNAADSCHDGARVLGDSSSAGASCGARPAAIATVHNTMTHNALSPASLSANDALLWAIARGPLNSATLVGLATDPGLRTQLHSFEGASLMKYIVSCALAPGARVDYGEPAAVASEVTPPWTGELGLCGPGSPYRDWATGAPSPECLQLVSSCVLARTNAIGKKVAISMRGEPRCLFTPLRREVPVETAYREPQGTFDAPTFPDIASFGDCAAPPSGEVTRGCGWAPLDVGRCRAGTSVTVCASASGTAPGSCDSDEPGASDLMLRVCKGLYGCDHGRDRPPYAGYLPSQVETRSPRPRVTFTCPNNGPLIRDGDDPRTGARYGYYSVMVASTTRGSLPGSAPDDRRPRGIRASAFVGGSGDNYPASENDVFTYPEGAFYGYLFPLHAGQLRSCSQSVAPDRQLSNDMYACFSDLWATPMAVLTDRYCAHLPSVTEPCFVNAPMACYLAAGDRCDAPVRSPDGYRACKGVSSQPAWRLPITVYLNHPCDLAGDGNCEQLHAIGKLPGFTPPQNFK
jgi:hypothetical protein